MSIDASFKPHSALRRFLDRFPNLQSIPRLQSLLQKGEEVTDDDVISAVAELFINPIYTIPLTSCFRAIVRKLVDKAVGLLLIVPNLTSINNDNNYMEIDDDDDNEDVVYIVNEFVNSGKSLRLHELACLALSRALDLCPFLERSVASYFEFAPPPFQRLLLPEGNNSQVLEKDGSYLRDAVRVSCRLLVAAPQLFKEWWDWSRFFRVVWGDADFVSGNVVNDLDVRWCAVKILRIVFSTNDTATLDVEFDDKDEADCFFRWEEFCQDIALEKAGWYLEEFGPEGGGSVDRNVDFNLESCLQSFTPAVSSCQSNEVETPRKNRKVIAWKRPFVLTEAVKKSFEMVLLAVSQKAPVLLYGPTGAGKTALINHMAQISGNRVLFIHMDEQMDGKTLIGNYICTDQPGEFRWQLGSLTQAVLNGFWIVFEDIDKAPVDVQTILLPLLEGASSFKTGRGEAISVAESFRLFATISSSRSDNSHNFEGRILGLQWRRVMISPSRQEDLLNIMNAWYPNLEAVANKLLETFERINTFVSHSHEGFKSSGFSSRDLLKWCKRIASCKRIESSEFPLRLNLSADECKCIYQEAVDIFAASYASQEFRLLMRKEVAKVWSVPAEETESLFPHQKPIIQESKSDLQIGRISIRRTKHDQSRSLVEVETRVLHRQTRSFVDIRSSLHALERIACSVEYNEPVLLVGETGTGKTTLVQNLAARLSQPLTVLNLSQQSDVSDLLGGFKPTDPLYICVPLYNEFMDLFSKTFSAKDNVSVLDSLRNLRISKNWKKIIKVFQKVLQKVLDYSHHEAGSTGFGTKRKRLFGEEVLKAWHNFSVKLDTARRQIDAASCMAFSFVEGAFVNALRNGHWILLDEVNLAPPETLQRIMGVLEGESGSLCLAERGDVEYIVRNSDFRLFACMNPATDAGKRDLPYSVRSRFTEYFLGEVLDDEELTLFINQFMEDDGDKRKLVKKIVLFYKKAKSESEEKLQDGANQKPQYSLRSLYRALEYMKKAEKRFGLKKALYDGFSMFFLTLLDGPSAKIMNHMISEKLLEGKIPPSIPFYDYLKVGEKFMSDTSMKKYILTDSVNKQLMNLSRAILIKRYPVLLQGPTSSGKTSLVHYLASVTGHEFVRINNHEHTDLQEYLGSYITNENGQLVFQEGVLVKAVRNGFWIVLDELNLAPSDVLEALNRLLDDNRELFVPELQETIRAHPNFMLFATQNPPTFYGGRKILSRAFRNRFVEIHVEEIPESELSTILKESCLIPESYARRMVDVMKDLQLHRQSSKVFAGKHGFMTPRDLFRWADRLRTLGISIEDSAKDGYFLLAERLRDENEKKIVQQILEKHHHRKLVENELYSQDQAQNLTTSDVFKDLGVPEHLCTVTWTKSMCRLFFLVERCYKLREPVLLVGETGGGKTTVCQLLSTYLRSKLHILNCHQYTETSDFIGGFHPLRDRSKLEMKFKSLVQQLLSSPFHRLFGATMPSSDIAEAPSTLNQLDTIINSYKQGRISQSSVEKVDFEAFEATKMDLVLLYQKWQTIFTWQDGPLIQAMKCGDMFLVDEISLADDSVLERLNSVLEPERRLSLAEKGGSSLESITAHPNFFLLATMNPGGDYGKKELSPALRNRFTEIWVPPVYDSNELRSIAERCVGRTLSYTLGPMMKFWEWFIKLQICRVPTVRDLLSWVDFMNATQRSFESSDYAFIHGAFLVLLDGISLGSNISKHDADQLRVQCLSFLLECLKGNMSLEDSQLSKMETYGWGEIGSTADVSNILKDDHRFGINPFYITKGDSNCRPDGFEFLAPTTCRNAMRVLRAMQLPKPVLLEGSPGVGKTSLIVALGKFSGHEVVRVNLSEQTDIMDLLGSDLPVDDAEGMKFAWSDGILLQAIKKGNWVLLDELNLAPQSVLEGLNAILDHRAEVFIPELGLTFKCPASFRVFACQNPSFQGGGRKGLPKSFLNRFTKVYVDELVEDDYLFICGSLHPSIPRPLLSKLITFNKRLYVDTMLCNKYGQDGSPWEFNLRDIVRSCQIIEGTAEKWKEDCFLNVIYIQRMRTAADRHEVIKLYEEIFGTKARINRYPRVQVNPRHLIVGNTYVDRNQVQPSEILKSQLSILPQTRHILEAVMHCVRHQWLCILVGPSSSGKTSLVRLLAHLTGNVLNELNLSHATDISELLGCFEQYNAYRNLHSNLSQVGRYINEYGRLTLSSSMDETKKKREDLFSKWFACLSRMNYNPKLGSASAYAESLKGESFGSLNLLVEIVEQIKLDLESNQLPISCSSNDLDKILKSIKNMQENNKKHAVPAKFEWVTGLLIRAIEHGEWVVLENANLCNPTVLDRLNSLVEPTGSITINEGGLVDGSPMTIFPHDRFRLFLSVNPKYGEVSRAMRNRGVEIFMMEPIPPHDGEHEYNCQEAEIKDVKRFLVLSGIPISKLVDTMAKAHMFAREAGLSFGIQITLLELTRWVQLFQQLLVNGNKPRWSLQVSWEHSYLSSLGEGEGKGVVDLAKSSFLSDSMLVYMDACDYSPSLPGGWPTPFRLRNLVFHSKEACVKQSCQYLEFLGSQYASHELSCGRYKPLVDRDGSFLVTYKQSIIPVKMVLHILFPNKSYQQNLRCINPSKFDIELAKKKLWFAANWSIEQATEADLDEYCQWFRWYSSQFDPYGCFFKSYLAILEQVLHHPIWKCMLDKRNELALHYNLEVDMRSLPLLSLKLMDFITENVNSSIFSQRLCDLLECVRLLFLSFQQWNAEDARHDHNPHEDGNFYRPLLESLRELEKKVLLKLVEDHYFVALFHLYSRVIEHHTLFWRGINSSNNEFLNLSWRFLEKDAKKLESLSLFPEEVNTLMVQSRRLVHKLPSSIHCAKSMLWVYGGHPVLPFSGSVYSKLQQLLNLCDSIWSKKTIPLKQSAPFGNSCWLKTVVSSNAELRSLAMQGVGMSSYITRIGGLDDARMVQQLEEMYQVLLRRLEYETEKLEAILGTNNHTSEEYTASCCFFYPELLCSEPSFNSWKEIVPLFESTSFSLDTKLLGELSSAIVVDAKELFKVLSNSRELLKYSLNFSLKFSSRPPTDFLPHQKILWALDAWESVDSVPTNVASSILEMWFRWHSSLCVNDLKNSHIDGCGGPLLFQPTKTDVLHQILNGAYPIKDSPVHSLKLRAASMNVWDESPIYKDLPDFLLSSARSLFQQIIYAHRKSIEGEKFAEIESLFGSFQGDKIEEENLQSLCLLISSSTHSRLTSSMDVYIRPLLKELYLSHPSHEFLNNIGHAWYLVGGLRFHLLLTPNDLDPAYKYSVKHSQLVEQISSFEHETKVRQECEYLEGKISTKDVLDQRAHALEKLEIERRRLQRKVVFRHDPSKFTKLKAECADFVRLVTFSGELINNIESLSTEQLINESLNWQEIAISFINRLSDEYAAYIDITQPVQVAVYEMRLGLSLVVASALQRTFLDKIEEHTTEQILETIYSFMRFPRSCAVISLDVNKWWPDNISSVLDVSLDIRDTDIKLLKKLCFVSRDTSCEEMVLGLESHAALYHNILVRVAQSVGSSLLMEEPSFKLLNGIFRRFARFWMSMKHYRKAREDDEKHNFTFKPRAFKLEDILEVDISDLRNSLSDESLCLEWQDIMAEDEDTPWAPPTELLNPEEEWNHIQDSILKDMVHIHNQLFGSHNLVEHPGIVQICDKKKLLSFGESYKLGTRMAKALPALLSSSLDAKLLPEHLLYLCLEYEEKFGVSYDRHRRPAYNFYKDSDTSVIGEMVKPLINLQHRVMTLLNQWPDHPGLKKILDIIEMMLAIPLSTPLAKALSGLQFLLLKAQMLEENDPKFSLSGHMQPILMMVSSWQKLELESWPALLEGVQEQYEINAGKLWFPLYSVLHREETDDVAIDSQSTIESLEEFILTSSVGEFKKRLELLLAFHGQLDVGVGLKFYSRKNVVENRDILYNMFGYYVQLLPIVSEHLEVNKNSVAEDLKKHVKLYRWDRPEKYLAIEISRRNRQKLRKLLQKYNDVLQQPVTAILSQDAAKRGIRLPSVLGPKISSGISGTDIMISPVSIDLKLFNDAERAIWYDEWRKKLGSAFRNRTAYGYNFQCLGAKDAEDYLGEIIGLANQAAMSLCECLIHLKEWKDIWLSLEKVCLECTNLLQEDKKSFRKRTALSKFLKLLESCGLSRHKSAISQDAPEASQRSSWFLHSSKDVRHLLLPLPEQPAKNADTPSRRQFQMFPSRYFDSISNWRIANEYYYKSMSQVQLVREICFAFHKDFSLDQVTRSASFLEHLIIIQQEQRSVAYSFTEDLRTLRKCTAYLIHLGTNLSTVDHSSDSWTSVSLNQKATHKCMWHQKRLFDSLYATSQEAASLLRKVESTHLNSCESVKVAVSRVLRFVEKYIPKFQKSKESLDYYLLMGSQSVTTPAACSSPFVATTQMEQLVMQNFQELSDFEEYLQEFSEPAVERRSLKDPLIGCFLDILAKVKVMKEEFYSVLEPRAQPRRHCSDDSSSDALASCEASFVECFNSTLKRIKEAFQKLVSPVNSFSHSEELLVDITHWKVLVESSLANLQLNLLCNDLQQTIRFAVELIDHVGHRNPGLCSQIQKSLEDLYVSVDPIISLGDGLLQEFLAMHRTVAEMTYMLAYVFASLYSRGLGGEDQTEDTSTDLSQDASGTGMGEGAGLNDVSDQINDEDQLLGTLEKPSDGQNSSNEVPSKDEKGIEMVEDFNADTVSVSEDSADDNSGDSEDEKVDSVMGETGDKNEVVDEKLEDKDEDGDPNNTNEKYESGPSVRDKNSNQRELRAKEDGSNGLDESEELNANDELNEDNSKDEKQNASDYDENMNEMNMDKEDPTGIEIDEQSKGFEGETEAEDPGGPDTNDVPEGPDSMEANEGPATLEDTDLVEQDEIVENGVEHDGMTLVDEDMKEAESENVAGNVESNDPVNDENDSSAMDLTRYSESAFELGPSDFTGMPTARQQMLGAGASKSNSMAQEAQAKNSTDMQNSFARSKGSATADVLETETMADSVKHGNLTADQPMSQSPEHDNLSVQRAHPNPYRNVGDALEEWKERVKVSIDMQEQNTEASGDMVDENAEEYGFVSEVEKGTSQALGPATSDQIDMNIKGRNPNDDGVIQPKENVPETEAGREDSELVPVKRYCAPSLQSDNEMQKSSIENKTPIGRSQQEETSADDCGAVDSRSLSGDLVSMKKSYMNEEILRLSDLRMNDEELVKDEKLGELSNETTVNATATLRWNELMRISTKLSQELAEQLRLVMEPTLASKLQGDYKTGKRINMKKVIPYIASHFRKDKIWMRRTKPNKRDYQVIVAVDDSQSMSEGRCGDLAVEALVTVCRAMSQLEVGQMAVASFGKMGNVRLLQDFDQPFTGESGMNMVSSFTFKQENTIADDPMVDLLKNLNDMLDAAVVNARLPSGHNPLQQLILIISDGNITEKEKLKPFVRDILNKKRMVAFLIVDSKQESIMDLPQVLVKPDGNTEISKYMDSFPFPYYIVLQNIDALPRTLADLLRQWFEMMQNARDY